MVFFVYYYGLIEAIEKPLFIRLKSILKSYERTKRRQPERLRSQ